MLELSDAPEQGDQSNAYKKALGYVNQAIEQEACPRYAALKATLLFKLGRQQESFAMFDIALEDCVNQRLKSEIFNNYACLCAQSGQQEKALDIWGQLENNEHYLTPEVALLNQSKVYVEKGDWKRAKNLLLKASRINPSYLDAHFYTALVAFQTNDVFLAKDKLRTVLLLEPLHHGAQALSSHIDNLSSQK